MYVLSGFLFFENWGWFCILTGSEQFHAVLWEQRDVNQKQNCAQRCSISDLDTLTQQSINTGNSE